MSLPQDRRRTEGDINLSARRTEHLHAHIDPATAELLQRDAQVFLHQSLSTPCLNALHGASGSELFDTQDRAILDFHGNSVHQVGYGHPHVVAAIKAQLDQLPFCPRRYTNEVSIALAERLSDLAPVRDQPARILFAPSGTAAIGMALKLARYATGRFKTISMWDSFHGASLDAISIGGEALFREGLGPLLPGCLHVPPYDPDGIGRDSAAYVDYVLEKERDIAAVVAEPMRWTTVVPPPPDYWKQIRESCDRHGALLILDEIPACLGRTGTMFCCEHFEAEPDIVVIGKGLGGGIFPLAAILARNDLNVAADRSLGHYTHEKSSVGCAAALATLEVLERESLLSRAQDVGRRAVEQLQSELRDVAVVHDIRGLGLQFAVDLRHAGTLATDVAEAVLYDCLSHGLSFKVAAGHVLALGPPLTISDTEMERALAILVSAIRRQHP